MKHPFTTMFAGAALLMSPASATTTSYNSGSLGAVANGTNSNGVTLNLPGVLAAPGDLTVGYSSSNTVVPYNPTINPSAGSPFTIEFWAKPSSSDGDDAVISNRTAGGTRAGWVFYQRAPTTGWDFRMYNGNGSTAGHDLTGGTATIGSWSHVVGVWDGSVATLYVNGVNTLAADGGAGGYVPNAAGKDLSIGSNIENDSPYNGMVDETAFYSGTLSPTQIMDHYNAASSTTPRILSIDGARRRRGPAPQQCARASQRRSAVAEPCRLVAPQAEIEQVPFRLHFNLPGICFSGPALGLRRALL